VNLTDIARGALADLESRILQTGGRVEIGELPTVEADPLQMHLLLQNLLSNGLKFHKPGEPPVVKIYARPAANGGEKRRVRSAPENIELIVEDNGIGFDIKYLDRIFQPFQRLHGRSEFEGSGIGLSICRKIVERYHGRIHADSSPNQGAKFYITLPVNQNITL
jgi:signal transduction histidine kinase